MTGFDFTRPLAVLARVGLGRMAAGGIALVLAIQAPWAYNGLVRVLGPEQASSYAALHQQLVAEQAEADMARASQQTELARLAHKFNDQAALRDPHGTCFGQQMLGQAGLDNIKASTVMLAVGTVGPDDTYTAKFFGTGFVVADSSEGGAGNRIVTAAHVVSTTEEDAAGNQVGPDRMLGPRQVIVVYASSGQLLGQAGVAAIGRAQMDQGVGDGGAWSHQSGGDVAVLHMDSYSERTAGIARYHAIPGLDLAATPGHGWMQGWVRRSTPGVDAGHSGSPVLDAGTGAVLGVAVQGRTHASAHHTYRAVDLWAMVDEADGAATPYADIELVTGNNFMAETLDDAILGVLGPQGRRVMAARAWGNLPNPQETGVLVPGMPSQSCVIAQASMGTINAWGTNQPLGEPAATMSASTR